MVHDDLHALDSGRFGEVRQVGAGNHATVFAAWDRELERAVAIKVSSQDTLLDIFGDERLAELGIADGLQQLVDELGAAAGQRYTLLREARMLAAVDHPNVIPALEVGLLDDVPAVVMPLLEGGSLAERSFEGSWREPIAVALELGDGLAALHREGILHRDFKPNNVLFDGHGRAVIADLGLACRIDDAEAMADWAGTMAYMAPETRQQRARDHRDDLYAFCVVVFQMLHGHHPFASDAARLAGRVSNIERPGGMPRGLGKVLSRGLHPNPNERWPNMDSLLEALRAACSEPRPRRWPYFLSGAAAAAIVGLLASSTVVHADTCTAVAHELDEDWNESIATELRGALDGDRGPAALSRWATRYLEVRRHECERARDSETPTAPSPCMRALHHQFSLTVASLRETSMRDGLDIDGAIAELPAPEACLDRPQSTASDPGSPGPQLIALREHDLAVAFAVALDDDERAAAALSELSAAAQASGSTLGVARADYWRGRLARRAGRLDEAGSALALALDAATTIDAQALWGEVAIELTALALDREEADAALAYAQLAHPVVSRHLQARLADLLELEARALVARGEAPAAVVRARLDQAQNLRERDIDRYEVGTRELEQTLAVRAEVEIALGAPDTAHELAKRGYDLSRKRKAPVEQVQVFRRLIFLALLDVIPIYQADEEYSTARNDAFNLVLDPYRSLKYEDEYVREYLWLVDQYERKGFPHVDRLRALVPRPQH